MTPVELWMEQVQQPAADAVAAVAAAPAATLSFLRDKVEGK
jgi:hypothetical protein